ncbi:MAG TPA: AsnC family transcriptional regulator [Rugosimonospora sp.]|jgi:DNA-binding Lrp family transcriptional regulator
MISATTTVLNDLDRRIVAALQVNGRAPWSRIAEVLCEPERTVARRGTQLLDEGLITITALPARHRRAWGELAVLALRCAPAAARFAAMALARRTDSTFAYLVAGAADCVAEIWADDRSLTTLLLDELPATPGLVQVSTHPILRYYRTMDDWQPGILTDDEAKALADGRPRVDIRLDAAPVPLTGENQAILHALCRHGRRTHQELARLAGISEATARRRLEALRAEGQVYFRTVVEPALLGLPVEALLWIRTAPADVDAVGEAVIASPLVRYAAAIMGSHQLLVGVTAPHKPALHALLARSPWIAAVTAMETSLVVSAVKRSGVLARSVAIPDDATPI